jgi:hypothetical protein
MCVGPRPLLLNPGSAPLAPDQVHAHDSMLVR